MHVWPHTLQIHFLSHLFRLLADAPVNLRGAFKRTTFFQRHASWPHRFSPALEERLKDSGSNDCPTAAAAAARSAFVYDDQGRGPAKLLTKLDINATSDVLEIHHDAQVSEWTGDGCPSVDGRIDGQERAQECVSLLSAQCRRPA
jgi:hypothetical protein